MFNLEKKYVKSIFKHLFTSHKPRLKPKLDIRHILYKAMEYC